MEGTEVDRLLADPFYREHVAGVAEVVDGEPPEFVEHQCWRMLKVWPHDDDESIPGRVECMGCGAVGRIEMEWRP